MPKKPSLQPPPASDPPRGCYLQWQNVREKMKAFSVLYQLSAKSVHSCTLLCTPRLGTNRTLWSSKRASKMTDCILLPLQVHLGALCEGPIESCFLERLHEGLIWLCS